MVGQSGVSEMTQRPLKFQGNRMFLRLHPRLQAIVSMLMPMGMFCLFLSSGRGTPSLGSRRNFLKASCIVLEAGSAGLKGRCRKASLRVGVEASCLVKWLHFERPSLNNGNDTEEG